MSLFEKATRLKYRFPTARGAVSVEDLWDMPLQNGKGFDLDTTAKAVNNELKASTEESFVTQANRNPAREAAAEKLEILKHIIRVRVDEQKDRENVAARQSEIRRFEDALARKREQGIEAMSEEEIAAKLAALKG